MKSDFLVALTQLAAERGLPKDKVMTAIEAALVSAFKKDSVTEGRNISVRLDPGSGDIQVDIIKRHTEYSQTMDKSKIFGINNIEYLKNTQKILVTNPKLKDRCYKNISKIIINIVKTELNMIMFNTL